MFLPFTFSSPSSIPLSTSLQIHVHFFQLFNIYLNKTCWVYIILFIYIWGLSIWHWINSWHILHWEGHFSCSEISSVFYIFFFCVELRNCGIFPVHFNMFIGNILIPSPKTLFHLYFFFKKRWFNFSNVHGSFVCIPCVCLVFSEVKKRN